MVSAIVWGRIPKNPYKKGLSVYSILLWSCVCVCVFKCIYFMCTYVSGTFSPAFVCVCLPAEHIIIIIIVHTYMRVCKGGADAGALYRGKNWFTVQRPIDPGEDVPRARVFAPPPFPRTMSRPNVAAR